MSNNRGVVVVTGSSGGIGEAICKKFLSEGFEVHRSEERRVRERV